MILFVAQISVAEAAHRLGVTVPRVYGRISDGSLRATRIGSHWVIEESDLRAAAESRLPGRPLSERSAWALIALSQADHQALSLLAPAERTRARERLVHLLAPAEPSEERVQETATLLRSWFRNRAGRVGYRAAPRDLPALRADARLTPSGLSHPQSGLASGDLAEGYVNAADIDAIIDDHLLSPAPSDKEANVILHTTTHAVREVSPLLLAADLADHRRPREEARAAELLRIIADKREDRS
jgi:excisionase family DNA binding protein